MRTRCFFCMLLSPSLRTRRAAEIVPRPLSPESDSSHDEDGSATRTLNLGLAMASLRTRSCSIYKPGRPGCKAPCRLTRPPSWNRAQLYKTNLNLGETVGLGPCFVRQQATRPSWCPRPPTALRTARRVPRFYIWQVPDSLPDLGPKSLKRPQSAAGAT